MKSKLTAERSRLLIIVSGCLWIAMVGTGFALLEREEFTPVPAVAASPMFPAGAGIRLAQDKPTLLLFAHPHCPCTRASLHELDGVLGTIQDRAAVTIVFAIPDGAPPHWEEGDLWDTAARLPGVRVIRDPAGRQAGRFNIKGSGHVVLYEPSGRLLFSGGITASRGHDGESAGQAAVVSLVLHGHALVNHTPVFGCSLL